jgi:hypothetical protein
VPFCLFYQIARELIENRFLMKSAGTWTAENPPPRKQKGMVSSKTKVKQALGIDHLIDGPSAWKAVDLYTSGNGAMKLIREMNKLKGKAYVQAWQAVVEYFKPKLQRSFIEEKREVNVTVQHMLQAATSDQKQKLLEVLRQMSLTNEYTSTELINNNSNTVNDDSLVYECIPNEQQSTDSDRVGEELSNHDNVAT